MNVADLQALLDSDCLNANEQLVWAAVMRWVKHYTAKRSKELNALLGKIRLGQFKEDFFRLVVIRDLKAFRPLDASTEELLKSAGSYYIALQNVAHV